MIELPRLMLALLACLLIAFTPISLAQTPAAAAPPTDVMGAGWRPTLEGRALVDALRAGGYVLYLRHTSTDFGQNDEKMTDYNDCAKQRNLTEGGRAEARTIAAALTALRIPVGDVLASPYCRTLETGRLVFGRATVSSAVRGGPVQPDNPDRYAALRALLSSPPKPGTNTAISSHGNPFYGVAGPPYLAEGELAVVKPLGNGKFEVAARIPKTAWASLVADR